MTEKKQRNTFIFLFYMTGEKLHIIHDTLLSCPVHISQILFCPDALPVASMIIGITRHSHSCHIFHKRQESLLASAHSVCKLQLDDPDLIQPGQTLRIP